MQILGSANFNEILWKVKFVSIPDVVESAWVDLETCYNRKPLCRSVKRWLTVKQMIYSRTAPWCTAICNWRQTKSQEFKFKHFSSVSVLSSMPFDKCHTVRMEHKGQDYTRRWCNRRWSGGKSSGVCIHANLNWKFVRFESGISNLTVGLGNKFKYDLHLLSVVTQMIPSRVEIKAKEFYEKSRERHFLWTIPRASMENLTESRHKLQNFNAKM